MIAGQSVDLTMTDRVIDFPTLEFIHSRKTGALFMASAALGATSARARGRRAARSCAYAKNLGPGLPDRRRPDRRRHRRRGEARQGRRQGREEDDLRVVLRRRGRAARWPGADRRERGRARAVRSAGRAAARAGALRRHAQEVNAMSPLPRVRVGPGARRLRRRRRRDDQLPRVLGRAQGDGPRPDRGEAGRRGGVTTPEPTSAQRANERTASASSSKVSKVGSSRAMSSVL